MDNLSYTRTLEALSKVPRDVKGFELEKLKKGVYIEPDFVEKNKFYYNDIEGRQITSEKFLQYKLATGYGLAAIATKLLFVYLGGLVQARKQFIHRAFYFTNSQFNWISALKYIAVGYVVGAGISTYTFGHPHLLEDIIRSKFRSLTALPVIERPHSYRFLKPELNRPPPKDLFIGHEYDSK